MKTYQFKISILTGLLFYLALNDSTAQISRLYTNTVSTADKNAIIQIFLKIDPNLYRLQFSGSNQVYGAKVLGDSDLVSVKKLRTRGQNKGNIVYCKYGYIGDFLDNSLLFIYARSRTRFEIELTNILGNEKANQLVAILSKYLVFPELQIDPCQ